MLSNDSNSEHLQSSEPTGWASESSRGPESASGSPFKTGSKSPRFIVIEGPLRVGKSTLARILAEKLHARRIHDCDDNPFLSDFYKEKPGSALRTQMYFLMERQKRVREALMAEAPSPVLADFLLEKDRIFANLNLDDEELKLYDRYYETLTAGIPAPDLVIYLQAKPEVLRARIEESGAKRVTLIGYSGGAALALLIADDIPEADRIVTVAGNLDIAGWVHLHRYSPLAGSLDPLTVKRRRTNVMQLHYAGARDENVPPAMIAAAAAQLGGRVLIINDFTHECCWVSIWQDVLRELNAER